ncbi:MAG: hypothetical protein LC754_14160 [Acidobacteria bacterium]|nr:hypothetical protein [Acidobacteriota bacterium]
MKRMIGVAAAFLALLSLMLVNFPRGASAQIDVNTTTPTLTVAPTPRVAATPDLDREEDVDSGRYGRNGMSFQDYLIRREQMINLLRGLPFSVPGNPRLKAIQLLRQQEAALRSGTTQAGATGSTGTTSTTSSTQLSSSPPPAWTSIGPAPIPDGQTNLIDATRNPVSGRVLTIAIHPTDPNKVYVGTAQGGLYRTLDGGQTWTALMDDALTLAVGSVTIDPLDPTTLFVGTGEGNFCGDCFFGVGFYIIKNAETTPTLLGPYNTATNTPNGKLANSRSITKILVNPTNDNTIFVGTGSGVGGINGGGGVGPDLTPRGLFRCENVMTGTPSCTKLDLGGTSGGPNVAVRDMVFEPGNANNLLIGIEDPVSANTNGIWRTTNALAATPSAIAFTRTLTTTAFTNVTLAIHKTGSAVTVYTATEDDANGGKTGVVRKSTDGGVTWPTVLTSSRGFCGGQCFYDMPIAVDPNDVNNVFIGGSGDYDATQTACKVTTNGNTFVKKAAGLHPDVHAIAIAPSSTSTIYHGNDGGIFKSVNDGNNWTSMNTAGFNATQFVSLAQHPTDRNFMIGGTQDNGTPFRQANSAWKLGQFGDGGYALIDTNATDTGTTVTAYHTFYNAKAGQIGFERADGASQIDPAGWPTFYGCGVTIFQPNGISCADDTLFYAPMAQGPGNPNTIYFGTDKVYRSSDKGVTMPAVSQVFETNTPTPPATPTNTTVSAIGISPQDDNVRLVGISSGRVFATTIGAPVMTDVTPPVTPRKFIGRAVIDPNNKKTAYVTLVGYGLPAGQHVWKTTNLDTATGAPAVTWTAAGNGLPDVPTDAFVIDPQDSNILYAGTDIGVYTSTDGGANWTPYGTGLPRVAVFDMAILNAHRVLRVATHGRGIWEIPIPGVTGLSAPSFFGVNSVADLHDGSRLLVSWLPAVSLNPAANIVYDIYRVSHVTHGDSTQDPTFTPDASNYVTTVAGTSFVDTRLNLAQVYYYIVQARDTAGGGLDTNGNGNRVTRFNAPTIPQVSANPPFALETFESASADSRFTPPLNEATTNPNQALAAVQRITVNNLGLPTIGKMYAPDFSPGDEANGCNPDPGGTKCGGQSDFYTQIGPFNGSGNRPLTATSILEFDNAINAEASFDGGVVEIKVGAPFAQGDATPFPDNTTVWDLGDYMIDGYYNSHLDGSLPAGGGSGSALQGRRAFSGVKPSHHVRAVLRNFAPGGLHNPNGLPVYIRFRMSSDVATANGVDSGWFVDNLVINDLACRVNVAAAAAGATATADSTYAGRNYSPVGAIDGERAGANWESGGGWNDNTRDVWPDSLTITFNGMQTISEIGVYTLQNNYTSPQEPTPLTPADLYGIRDFEVQTCNGLACTTIPTVGTVTGNDKAMRVLLFAPINATGVRIKVNNGREHFSRITEVEAFGCGAQP